MKKVCFLNPRLPMFVVAKASETRPTPDIGLTTEARNRFATTYAFLPVCSHIIIINVCECCVDYINMLMQLTSITVINILTMSASLCTVLYLIILMVQSYSGLQTT